jgi:hypothetical protein
MTTDTCGTKLLELLPSANQGGLLEKMLTALLTSPMVQSCDRYTKIWKKRVSKSNVLLFQLAVSVHGIKGKESGSSDTMYRTPTTMDIKEDSLKHATKLMQGKTTRASGERVQVTLADQVMMEEIKQNPELMKIYQDHTMVTRKNLPPQKDFVTYLKSQTSATQLNKQVKIKKTTIEHWFRNDKCFSYPSPEDWEIIKPHLKEIKYDHEMTTLYPIEWTPTMYPTPAASNIKGSQANRVERTQSGGFILRKKNKPHMTYGARLQDAVGFLHPKAGGKLNPNFVEFLMGYPTNYTRIEPTESKHSETQSCHKSPNLSENQF